MTVRTRKSQFVSTVSTAIQPSAGTATVDSDTLTLGEGNEKYTAKNTHRGGIADITALKALVTADVDRVDGQNIIVNGKDAIYRWNAASTTAGDDDTVVTPDDITEPAAGRWLKISIFGAGGAGSGAAAGISLAEQKYGLEDTNNFTARLPDSVGSGFNIPFTQPIGYFWEDYPGSGTDAVVIWNPIFLESGDEDTDSAASWAVQDAGLNLTTSVTSQIGANSLDFEKTTGNTRAAIRLDATGSADRSVANNTNFWFWMRLSSVTDLTNVEIRIDINGTDYETYTATADHTGTAISTIGASTWFLMKFDLSAAGTSSGAGWDFTQLFRYLHIGVNTGSASQTYSEILVDGVAFEMSEPEKFGIQANERTAYDTSNIDAGFMVSSASTRISGAVTLASALSNSYTAGFAASGHGEIKTSTHLIEGVGAAHMEDGLSGAVADTQTTRIQEILPEAVSAQNFDFSMTWGTNMYFTVLSVPGTGSFTVDDPVDSTSDILNGGVFDAHAVYYKPDGRGGYVPRSLAITVSSSSHSAGVTTVNNSGSNSGLQVGDLVVLRQIENEQISCVSLGVNESYAALTVDDRIVEDVGMKYPNAETVWAHWTLGGDPSEAVRNRRGSGPDLSITGSLTTKSNFLFGRFGSSGFNDASTNNYALSDQSASQEISGDSADNSLVQYSFWWYDVSGFSGSERWIITNEATTANGMTMSLASGANTVLIKTGNGASQITSGTYLTGRWNHGFLKLYDTPTDSEFYLNGALSVSGVLNPLAATYDAFYIGRRGANTSGTTGTLLADVIIWRNGSELTQKQIASLAKGVPVGQFPKMINRGTVNSLSGQKLALKADTVRDTDFSSPFIDQMTAIKM